MKTFLSVLLAVVLLVGCTPKQPPEPSVDIQEPELEIEPVGIYVPDSKIEQRTRGALRMYALPEDAFWSIENIGNDLLVTGQTKMLLLTGETAIVTETTLPDTLYTGTLIDAGIAGTAYYLPESRKVVVWDAQLKQTVQMELPENIVGMPVISLDQAELFYSTGSEIRALNLSTGIARLLRRQSELSQEILAGYFDLGMLLIQNTDKDGNVYKEYVSIQTGQPMEGNVDVLELHSLSDRYLVTRYDGRVYQTIVGLTDAKPLLFTADVPSEETGGRVVLLELDGILDYDQKEGLSLCFYSLSQGKKVAVLEKLGVSTPSAFHCDGRYIWFLADDEETGKQSLYRWDITKSQIQEDANYIEDLHTLKNPDAQNLALCQEQAQSIENQYGVVVSVWLDAIEDNAQYTAVPEHQPQTLSAMLTELDTALALFPEGFLEKTIETGDICISLVRSISGNAQWAQYWQDGDCHILISSAHDAGLSALQGIAYAIDSKVLGNSRDYDDWSDLNPVGFAYFYQEQIPEDSQYLENENRAFADARAMTYPHEDRCRTFYYAMLQDNQEMFAGAVMQAKLFQLCSGIREAYGIEDNTQVYPWEQYLNTPMEPKE